MRRISLILANVITAIVIVGILHTILEAQPCPTISEKYAGLGGSSGFLGAPTSEERPTADGIGRYRDYQGGSIYWTPQTCAHEIHAPIKDKWISLNAERGPLGYPITDVIPPPDVRLPPQHRYGAIFSAGPFMPSHGDLKSTGVAPSPMRCTVPFGRSIEPLGKSVASWGIL